MKMKKSSINLHMTKKMMMNNMNILHLFLVLLSPSVFASSGSESDNAAASPLLNPCDLSGPDYGIFCECDTVDNSAGAARVRCGVWRNPNDTRIWESMVRLKNVVDLQFPTRIKTRPLQSLPPPRIFGALDTLKYIDVKAQNLGKLEPYVFGNSSSLFDISLENNQISNLEENSLSNMEQLNKINLGNNSITEINREVFVNLPHLQALYLDRNKIQVVHEKAFQDLSQLRELDLKTNEISVLTREVFTGLGRLERLELQDNRISFLGSSVFEEMRESLYEIDLSRNEIKSVSPTAFSGLERLVRLHLRNNKLSNLDPMTFTYTKGILFLDLKRNEFKGAGLGNKVMEPMFDNLRNGNMQLFITENQFSCTCHILWIPEIYKETNSTYVKEHLEGIRCRDDSEDHHHHSPHDLVYHDSHGDDGKRTTALAFTTATDDMKMKPVIGLTSDDVKCPREPQPPKDLKQVEPFSSSAVRKTIEIAIVLLLPATRMITV